MLGEPYGAPAGLRSSAPGNLGFGGLTPGYPMPRSALRIRYASSNGMIISCRGPKALDGDVILAAQALTMNLPAEEMVVATTNVGLLARLVPAKLWQEVN